MAGVARRVAPTLFGALALTGCGSGKPRHPDASGRELTVYASVPLRGPSAFAGRDVADGERLALEQSGSRAGSQPVRLRTLDATDPKRSTWTPAQVALNARLAARDPSTIAYLGEVDPSASGVSLVTLNEQGILELSPTDSFAGTTEPTEAAAGEPEKFYPTKIRTFARLVPDDNLQARVLAGRLRAVRARRVVVLDDDQVYGRAIAAEVARRAPRRGLRVVAAAHVDPSARSFVGLIDDLRRLAPDAVLYAGSVQPGLGAFWRALRTGLPHARLFAPGALALPGLAPRLPHAALTSPVAPLGRGTASRAFARAFARRFGRAPGPWAAYGHEAMRVVLDALRRAGPRARDRRTIVREVLTARPRDAVIGRYSLGPRGETTLASFVTYRVRGGRLELTAREPSSAPR